MSRLLVEEIPYGDPLAAFAGFAALEGATFLDSARPDGALARYSFIMAEPFLTLKSRDGLIEDGEAHYTGDPFRAGRGWPLSLAHEPGLPPFRPVLPAVSHMTSVGIWNACRRIASTISLCPIS
jgi:hypothetical protein